MTRLASLLPILLFACGDNKKPGQLGDGGVDGPDEPFELLASFDVAAGQLPEGVTSINNEPFVGLAQLGQVVRVKADKTFEVHGTLPGTVMSTFTLGLAALATGEILVGVGASGANPMPAPGVYKIPAGGGAATLFSSNAAMTFPNAIVSDGTNFYVTDSAGGRIFKVPAAGGAATVWSQNAMLAGDMAACGGTGAPFKIGANGIATTATDNYVAVTDFGRILRIPINANGSAGTPVVVAESCADLQGIDGIVLDTDGSIIGVRNGPSLELVRVAADGSSTTVVEMGAPLDGPASVAIDAPNGARRLLVTNSAFFSGAAGKPSLLAYDL